DPGAPDSGRSPTPRQACAATGGTPRARRPADRCGTERGSTVPEAARQAGGPEPAVPAPVTVARAPRVPGGLRTRHGWLAAATGPGVEPALPALPIRPHRPATARATAAAPPADAGPAR